MIKRISEDDFRKVIKYEYENNHMNKDDKIKFNSNFKKTAKNTDYICLQMISEDGLNETQAFISADIQYDGKMCNIFILAVPNKFRGNRYGTIILNHLMNELDDLYPEIKVTAKIDSRFSYIFEENDFNQIGKGRVNADKNLTVTMTNK